MIIFNGKQHVTIFILSVILLYVDAPSDLLYFSLGGLLGSLLPDIDHRESIAGHIIPAWLIFTHGKQTHTLLVVLALMGLHAYYKHDFLYGIWFGYLGHLLGDNMQGNNLKYLYFPFKRKKKVKKQ